MKYVRAVSKALGAGQERPRDHQPLDEREAVVSDRDGGRDCGAHAGAGFTYFLPANKPLH